MIVYKRVFRWKRARLYETRALVEFKGIFLLGIIPLILWQVSDEDRR